MKSSLVCTVAVTTLLAAGCSVSVNYDYDTKYDFAALKTYGWLPVSEHVGMDEINIRRVEAAVNHALQAKGYQMNADAPDFLVEMHAGTHDRIDVQSGRYGRGGWWGPPEVYQYQEGVLILDMVDAHKQEMFWRGTATSVLDSNPSVEQRIKRIGEAVDKMLANFPPPPRK